METDAAPSTSGREAHESAAPEKRGTKRKQPRPNAYVRSIKDPKQRAKQRNTERVYAAAQKSSAKINNWLKPEDAGFLEAEGLEETWRFQQRDIVAAVDQGAAAKAFDLALPQLGPYKAAFSRDGRHAVLGGAMGHLAVLEWQRAHLTSEVQVKEVTRDVTFLHNHLFYAAAQKKYVYIYDKRGIEVHCLRDHVEPAALQFLPHHFLLASIGDHGVLRYQDTSTGGIVAQHRTRLGPCHVLRQNPHNAVLCAGHSNGVVTMWTPNQSKPVVRMLTQRGALVALAVDPTGRQLVTAGLDCQVKVWDVRTYQPLHAYFSDSPVTAMDISQKGLLALAQGRRVQVWRDSLTHKAQSPYMTAQLPMGSAASLAFCPFEDVLLAGCAGGISSLLVPGAGEPNIDSLLANPYASLKERREQEVAQLLDKLQPDTIMLDPEAIGKVAHVPVEVQKQRRQQAAAANAARLAQQRAKSDEKVKMKGKNKPTRRQKKKQVNIIEERKPAVAARVREEEARRREEAAAEKAKKLEAAPRALQRFYK